MSDTDPIKPILCPYCGAMWKNKNVVLYDLDADDQCEDGRFDPPNVSFMIVCHACDEILASVQAAIIRDNRVGEGPLPVDLTTNEDSY